MVRFHHTGYPYWGVLVDKRGEIVKELNVKCSEFKMGGLRPGLERKETLASKFFERTCVMASTFPSRTFDINIIHGQRQIEILFPLQ